ncbi:MAG: hypothetical protein ACLPKI_26620 [Streptosporangiaceae bacterium]
MATEYHAEHVGSLLRPAWLLDARTAHQRGQLDSGWLSRPAWTCRGRWTGWSWWWTTGCRPGSWTGSTA